MPSSVAAWIAGSSLPASAPKKTQNPYFVTVGTIEGRKNHLMLLEVWERLARSMGDGAPHLVIIGQRGWEADATFRRLDNLAELAGSIREIGDCEDHELVSWIAGARALLMPSIVEGFGLPVVEALGLGTPVIASDLPIFHEIAGDIPTYVDPHDQGAWEHAVRSFLENGEDRARQLRQIRTYRSPDWNQHFQTVEKWLNHLTQSGESA